jgi:hypothetical protein
MITNASGRSALILATGLFVCFAEPSRATAATSADDAAATAQSERVAPRKFVRHGSRHWKRYAHRRYSREASKSSETKKAAATEVVDAQGFNRSEIPASVANANAQMTAGAPADDAAAMSAKASTMLLAAADRPEETQPAAATPTVASDQLNDADRTLQQSPLPSQTVGMAVARAEPAASVVADGNDGWDRTSLIGKIFIGFGALLTMASAARMLMA